MSDNLPSRDSTDWLLVLLLWTAGLGAAAQYGKVSVIYPDLETLYPGTGAWLGFAVSLVGLIGMILGVVAGIIVARIRFRRALLVALWLGAVLSAYQATLPSLPLFLVSRGLEGASHLALVVAAPTLIAELTAPRHAGFTLTLWGTFFGVAYALLTFLGVPLADAYGVPALFAAHALWLAIMAAILGLRLPRIERPAPDVDLSAKALLTRHLTIYRSPFIGAAGVGWLFYTFCFVSILTLLPFFLSDALRQPVIGAMPLVSIASSLTLGVWLLRFVPAVTVIVVGFCLSAGFALAMALIGPEAWVCLALAASLGLVQGASFAAVAELTRTPGDRALAYGAMAQTGNIGNTLGTPVMAAIISVAGFVGLMASACGLLVLGAVAHLHLARLRVIHRKTHETP